jgi:endogenous inhibitor of DNA gyrase (YacG/DUF329 family)
LRVNAQMALARCSLCGKWFNPEESSALPFCSLRCKQMDLGRWLDERYGLPCEGEEITNPPADPSEEAGRHSE